MLDSVFLFTEPVTKKPRTFYGKDKVSLTNETAVQALKRTKAMDAVKETKIGNFVVDIVDNFVIVIFSD